MTYKIDKTFPAKLGDITDTRSLPFDVNAAAYEGRLKRVFKKYALPETAVKGLVLAVVHQLTVPVLPNPVCVAPHPKVTLWPDVPKTTFVPGPPTVIVEPFCLSIVFTSILDND